MQRDDRPFAQKIVVSGLAVLAIGYCLYCAATIHKNFSIHFSSVAFETLFNALQACATVIAVWWLLKVLISAQDSRDVVRKALYGFAIANFFLSIALGFFTAYTFSHDYYGGWSVASLGIEGAGSLAAAFGFLGLAQTRR